MSSLVESIVRTWYDIPNSQVHGANLGPIWGRQDPGGRHVGPMNFAIWDTVHAIISWTNPKQWLRTGSIPILHVLFT